MVKRQVQRDFLEACLPSKYSKATQNQTSRKAPNVLEVPLCPFPRVALPCDHLSSGQVRPLGQQIAILIQTPKPQLITLTCQCPKWCHEFVDADNAHDPDPDVFSTSTRTCRCCRNCWWSFVVSLVHLTSTDPGFRINFQGAAKGGRQKELNHFFNSRSLFGLFFWCFCYFFHHFFARLLLQDSFCGKLMNFASLRFVLLFFGPWVLELLGEAALFEYKSH